MMTLNRFHYALLAALLLSATPSAGEDTSLLDQHFIDLDIGFLQQVGHSTSIDYQIVPLIATWRSPAAIRHTLGNNYQFAIRHSGAAYLSWIATGPEDIGIGLAFAPSLELISPDETLTYYASIGGGIGLINSHPEIEGGQGQDFHLNWFAKGGVRFALDNEKSLQLGVYFQHLSNGGQTDPNPGIDALGFTAGISIPF